jgi:hypothetical protein
MGWPDRPPLGPSKPWRLSRVILNFFLANQNQILLTTHKIIMASLSYTSTTPCLSGSEHPRSLCVPSTFSQIGFSFVAASNRYQGYGGNQFSCSAGLASVGRIVCSADSQQYPGFESATPPSSYSLSAWSKGDEISARSLVPNPYVIRWSTPSDQVRGAIDSLIYLAARTSQRRNVILIAVPTTQFMPRRKRSSSSREGAAAANQQLP